MESNNIAKLRKERGLNQKELGEEIQVAQTTVSGWETGKNEPSGEDLGKLSNFFGVNIGYILGREKRRNLKNEQEHSSEEWEDEATEEELENYQLMKWLQKQNRIKLEEEWQKELPDLFFEIYLIAKASEFMSAQQKSRLLTIAQAAFPKAFNSIYETD